MKSSNGAGQKPSAVNRAEGRGYEPASVLLERILVEREAVWAKSGKKGEYKVPAAPNSSALGRLPEGWCWATIEQLCRVGTGATPKRGDSRYWLGGDVPWVTSSVVNGRFVDHPTEFVTATALSETNLKLYPPCTLLVAMYGEGKTRGRCAVRPPKKNKSSLGS